MVVLAGLGINVRAYLKNIYIKQKNWGQGLNGRAPAWQAQSSEFKFQDCQNKTLYRKNKKIWTSP
jgi:hypothetical protein